MQRILGIGNALVDVIVNLPDERLLKAYELPKGGMQMIDAEKKRQIHAAIREMKQTLASGGSTSNTIHGLARLGASTGYIGKVGKDEMGKFFESDMQKSGIEPHLIHSSEIDTGIATTLMTQDAERTFATYLGAASAMIADEINPVIFKNYNYVHVEGYLIFNHDLILKVCQMAQACGLKISMDMASFNLVEEHHDFVEMLLKEYVSIIFANEEEAKAFTGKEGEEALEILSQYCPIAIVKLGGKGSIANINGKRIAVGTNGKKPIDTNGAGDIFAAGFLFGLLNNWPEEKTGRLAARLGDEMVSTIGAKLSDNQWEIIKKEWDL